MISTQQSAHDTKVTTPPITTAFDNPVLETFGLVYPAYETEGWNYVIYQESALTRRRHFAIKGEKVTEMDFTPFREMERMVFGWMVELDFPTRRDLPFASHFDINPCAPLRNTDVERIWMWRHVNEVA